MRAGFIMNEAMRGEVMDAPASPARTVSDLVSFIRYFLSDVDSGTLSVIVPNLLHYATGFDKLCFLTDGARPVDDWAMLRLESALVRYDAGESIWNILGWREFWGRRFDVSNVTLEPRPDTEILVEWALDVVDMSCGSIRILDLGVGSGCLLVSLLCEWDLSFGTGCDISPDALVVAGNNARLHGVDDRACFLRADWRYGDGISALGEGYDVIVCNPPYIDDNDYAILSDRVLGYDPPVALYGGRDGLDCFRDIIELGARLLRRGGYLFLEIGAGQSIDVEELLFVHCFHDVRFRRDLSGVIRGVSARI